MTAATSPRSSAICTALMSFGGQMTTWSSMAPGTPADIGTSYGGVSPPTAAPWQPWEGALDFSDFRAPGGGGAPATAQWLLSGPHHRQRPLPPPRGCVF